MGIDAVRTFEIPGFLHIVPISGSDTLCRAHQLSKDRAVALRFLDWTSNANAHPRSDSVVRALQILSHHPHVVTVYGSGHVANGPMYLLLELLEDGSLGEWVAADGRLPCAEVLEVAVKVSGALETAHRAGIVHGRLRAESILVSPSGEPQLAGLDQAVFRHVQALTNGTTPASVNDDLTGLTSTMFTLLTAAELPDRQVQDVLERCEVPPPVRGLLERCLATDHASWPMSMRDLTVAIQQVQQALGLTVTDTVVDERAVEKARKVLQKAIVPLLAKPEPAEPESEPDEPAPEPWLVLPAPTRPAHWRWRRLVAATVLTFLAAATTLFSAHTLRRQRPPQLPQLAVDHRPPAVVVDQPVSNRDAVYTGFRTIADDSGQLSMIVPEEWSAIRSSPWVFHGEHVGNRLEAALAGPAGSPWNRPFVVLAASQTLGATRTVDQVLDELRISPDECTYVGRAPFNDNLYAGAIDSYTGCGQSGARAEILVATSKKPSHLVMVQVSRVKPRDESARDRILETFQVNG
jgi:Protein tyrosine and serine/threonine kinase